MAASAWKYPRWTLLLILIIIIWIWQYQALFCSLDSQKLYQFFALHSGNGGPSSCKKAPEPCIVTNDEILRLLNFANITSEAQAKMKHRQYSLENAINITHLYPLLPCLKNISEPENIPIPEDCYQTFFSPEMRSRTYEALHHLYTNFTANGLTLILSDGSLIGSMRHLGIIPWDDDIDFLILNKERRAVRRLLLRMSLSSKVMFIDTERTNQHWKLGILCTETKEKLVECPVQIDFFFADVTGFDLYRPEWPYFFFRYDIFPLRLLPFGPILLPGPNRPMRFLARQYQTTDILETCSYRPHSSKTKCDLPCRALHRTFPFVYTIFVKTANTEGHSTLRLLVEGQLVRAAFFDEVSDMLL